MSQREAAGTPWPGQCHLQLPWEGKPAKPAPWALPVEDETCGQQRPARCALGHGGVQWGQLGPVGHGMWRSPGPGGLGTQLRAGPPQVQTHGTQLLTAMLGGLDDPHGLVALEAMAGLSRLLGLVEPRDVRPVLLHVAIRIRPFFDSVCGPPPQPCRAAGPHCPLASLWVWIRPGGTFLASLASPSPPRVLG